MNQRNDSGLSNEDAKGNLFSMQLDIQNEAMNGDESKADNEPEKA